MKKNLYLLASAALILTGCSSDDYVGNTLPDGSDVQNPIAFISDAPNMTRVTGTVAATALDNRFIVWGQKDISGTKTPVFENYLVTYTEGTGGDTNSNSHGWEYVGNQSYFDTSISQTIKYWDKSASYTFTAFSAPENVLSSPASGNDKVKVTKLGTANQNYTDTEGYSVTVKNGADFTKVFFSDKKDIATSATASPVILTFRSFASKVRIGLYEDVPGYNVKIDKFTVGENVTLTEGVAAVSINYPSLDATDAFHTYTVGYNQQGDNNVARLTHTEGSATSPNIQFGDSKILKANTIATTSGQVTLEEYQNVLPYPHNTENTMTVTVDYTLISTDNSGEEIKVTGKSAVVPVEFLKWQPNFAYTYIFKISEESGELTPITFDAIVEESQTTEQQTVTQVVSPGVTTYAKSNYTLGSGDYKVGADIYAVLADAQGVVQAQTLPEAEDKKWAEPNDSYVYKVAVKDGETLPNEITSYDIEKALNAFTTLSEADDAIFALNPVSGVALNTGNDVPMAEDNKYFGFTVGQALKFNAVDDGWYVYLKCTKAPTIEIAADEANGITAVAAQNGEYIIKVIKVVK